MHKIVTSKLEFSLMSYSYLTHNSLSIRALRDWNNITTSGQMDKSKTQDTSNEEKHNIVWTLNTTKNDVRDQNILHKPGLNPEHV